MYVCDLVNGEGTELLVITTLSEYESRQGFTTVRDATIIHLLHTPSAEEEGGHFEPLLPADMAPLSTITRTRAVLRKAANQFLNDMGIRPAAQKLVSSSRRRTRNSLKASGHGY